MNLRPYQQESLNAIVAGYRANKTKGLVVLPTAAGKTVVFSQLPQSLAMKPAVEKMLVIVHRDELAVQTKDKMERCNPHLRVEIEKAEQWASLNADVVVASVQTLGRNKLENGTYQFSERIQRFPHEKFRYIIADEAHHATADSWRSVLAYFRVLKGTQYDDPTKLFLAVTATPRRADNIGMETICDEIYYSKDIASCIREGWLTDIKAYRVDTTVDLSSVGISHGDFNVKELERTVNTPERNRKIVEQYLEHGEERQAICFTVDVQHAVDVAEEFTRAGVSAAVLTGKTPREERRKILRLHQEGYFRVLTNCGVLCLDSETEILTSAGWIGINEMTHDHEVANWDNGRIFFDKPRNVVVRNREPGEKMVSISNRHRNIRVTEDHQMVWRTCMAGKDRKTSISEIVGRQCAIPLSGLAAPRPIEPVQPVVRTPSQVKRAIQSSSYYYRKANGLSFDESVEEAKRRHSEHDSLRRKKPDELSLDECWFIGFWLGDGSRTALSSGGVEYILTQSKVYPKIIEKIDRVLDAMGVDYIRREKHNESGKGACDFISWSLPRGTGFGPQKRNGLFGIEPYLEKNGTPLWWGLNEPQFDSFIQGYWYANGTHRQADNGIPKTINCCCASKQATDLIQAIAVCRGYTCSVNGKTRKNPSGGYFKTLYNIYLRKQKYGMVGTKGDCIEYEDRWKEERVWCVTSTSGNIVTRRRGKVCITGNCEGYDDPNVMVALMARPTKSGTLYTQCVGRVLRPSPSPEELAEMFYRGEEPPWIKPYAIVIDFCDLSSRHSLIDIPTLFGMKPGSNLKGKKVHEEVEQIRKAIEQQKLPVRLDEIDSMDTLRAIAVRVNLLTPPRVPEEIRRISRFSWIETAANGWSMALPDRTVVRVQMDTLGHYEVSKSLNGIKTVVGKENTLEAAIERADQMVPQDAAVLLTGAAAWRKKPISDPQIRALWFKMKWNAKYKKNLPPTIQDFYAMARKQYPTMGHASDKLNELASEETWVPKWRKELDAKRHAAHVRS